jgi:hypothetical protein
MTRTVRAGDFFDGDEPFDHFEGHEGPFRA